MLGSNVGPSNLSLYVYIKNIKLYYLIETHFYETTERLFEGKVTRVYMSFSDRTHSLHNVGMADICE